MAKNTPKIPDFLSEKNSIVLFVLFLLALSVLFVLIYKPLSLTDSFASSNFLFLSWNQNLYVVLIATVSFILLILSRIVFYITNLKHHFLVRDAIIWLISEFLIISLVSAMLASLFNTDTSLAFIDILNRVFFNILSVVVVPYALTVMLMLLFERGRIIKELSAMADMQTDEKQDSNENVNFYDRGGKLAFSTRRDNLLFIEAADNYCNIHYINVDKLDTFILHNSLKSIASSDKYQCLLRCHRSYMVNLNNVKLLRKDKDGLLLELSHDARSIPVSRSYYDRVVRSFAGDSSI